MRELPIRRSWILANNFDHLDPASPYVAEFIKRAEYTGHGYAKQLLQDVKYTADLGRFLWNAAAKIAGYDHEVAVEIVNAFITENLDAEYRDNSDHTLPDASYEAGYAAHALLGTRKD